MIGPRSDEIGISPDGVFESRMTCGLSGARRLASSSAQNAPRAASGSWLTCDLTDREDLHLDHARRYRHLHRFASLVALQSAADRGLVADLALGRRGLGRADDHVLLLAALSLDGDVAADLDDVVLRLLVDQLRVLDHLLEGHDP